MLVLGRKVGEKIFIGDNVSVTVLEVKGDRIRLGFEADKTIPIHRAEVRRQITEVESEHVCAEGKHRERATAAQSDCRQPNESPVCVTT